MKANCGERSDRVVSLVLMIGAVWGIFEATAGYLLHLLPVSIGFLVWYPVAVFFLMAAYRATGKRAAVLNTALLAAAIKLLNLMLPGRIDRVINPAVSILLEGVAVVAAIYALEHVKWTRGAAGRLLVSIGMNSLWRAAYLAYLAFAVPDWMREISALSSAAALTRFMVIDNLASSLIVFVGMLMAARMEICGGRLFCAHHNLSGARRALAPAGLLALSAALQIML